MRCLHENFRVQADIHRLQDAEDKTKINAFVAEITIRCVDCDLPFEFVGVDACGYGSNRPHVNTSAQELRAPIKPKGCLLMPGIPGYTVKASA